MSVPVISIPATHLARIGLRISDSIHYQLSPEELVHHALQRGDGVLNDTGALVIKTGEFTGRSPKDKFIVKDHITSETVNWNEFNIPLEEKYFDIIYRHVINYINKIPELWIRDCHACADTNFRLSIRVINETPSMNLFAYNMFLRPKEEELDSFQPQWHIISVPGLRLDPKICGTRQHNATVVSFKHKIILIAGSGYT